MVCIIDDREDVWNFAPNLIMVKPYKYFSGTDDVNDPFKANSSKDNKEGKTSAASTNGTASEENSTKEDENKDKAKNGETSVDEKKDDESKNEERKGNIQQRTGNIC